MKVLFLCQDSSKVDWFMVALMMRWPDTKPLIATSGRVALQVIEQEPPDVVFLCDDLPDLSIFAAIKGVRDFSDVPLVVATNGASEVETVKAFELGADEYIHLPCSLMEVMARVMALWRRVSLTNQPADTGPIVYGDLVINPASYEVHLHSTPISLTPTEFKLLFVLAKNRHITVSLETIQRVLWESDGGPDGAIKKYVQRLRHKLGDDASNPTWIKTVHGRGYMFTTGIPAPPLAPSA